MTTTHSAPGKTHLFGERAIVYSMKTIAFTTNIRTTATVAESKRTISGEKTIETITMEAKSTFKLPEEFENLIKKEWRTDKSEPIRR